MERKKIQTEEQTAVERSVLLIHCCYCVILTVITIKIGWSAWTAVLLDMCWLISAVMKIAGFRSYQFRAYVTAGTMQICIVLWSVCDASLSMTAPALFSMAAMLGLYGIPEIVYIMAASTTFLNFYHIVIKHSSDALSDDMVYQTLLEVVSVYSVEYIMYFLVKKRLEDTQKQMDVIASLKAVEQSKDDFLANVSHEIRTPINTICGMSEIVLRAELADDVRSDVFSIQTAGRNLLSVVSDVLDFSELQSGNMTLAEESYNITSTINDIINMSMARKNERRIELIVDCNANIPNSLVGDEQKIRRVIMNLVNNALKFTMEGCVSIIIFSRETDYGINLIVRVKDTGIGMKKESLEKLFTSFNQVDTRRNRQEGGIGLGLAISQAMVEKMGGFITVASEYGKGSEVQFVVPQKVADHAPIAAVHDPEHLNVAIYINMEQFTRTEIRDEYSMVIGHITEQLKVKKHICQNLSELKRRVEREIYSHIFISLAEYEEGREFFDKMSKMTKVVAIIDRPDDAKIKNPKIMRLYKPLFILPIIMVLNDEKVIQGMDENYSYHGRFIAPGTNVLAVDDNLMNIRVLEGLLRPYKIKVSMATSGAEALDKIESMDYDFVFMDHMMPEMDGIETLHRIRQKPGNYFKKIPVIALTANAIGGMREVFLDEGFQDFMAKPIELSVLERVLRRNLPQEKMIHVAEEDIDSKALDCAGDEKSKCTPETGAGPAIQHADLHLERFNEAIGLRYCGGVENYIEVLRLNFQGGYENRQKIQECFDSRDWKNYTVFVHGLKSSMLSIGAEGLSGMAKELEYAGKQADERFIMEHHNAMMSEYAQVLQEMENSPIINPDQGQEDLSGLEALEEAQMDRIALEFEDAAFAFDGEQMAEIAGRLAKCSYHGHALAGLVEPVMRKIEMSDYMSASEAVSRLKDRLG